MSELYISPDQRVGNNFSGTNNQIQSALAGIYTSLPGTIIDFNPTEGTCSVQPAIDMWVNLNSKLGDINSITLPLLKDCPVVFPGGGGCQLTFPLQKGDECLIVFASRCIDRWWYYGAQVNTETGAIGGQPPIDLRMHDISDGFIIPGVKSKPKVISNISTTSTQLRSNNGSVVIDIDTDSNTLSLNAPNLRINGNLEVTGTIKSNGKVIDNNHKHVGVQPGSGTSGVVL